MFPSKSNFIRRSMATFIGLASLHAIAGVPYECELPVHEEMVPDITIELTTSAWAKGDPAQCSIVDANQIVNDGKNTGYSANPNLRTNACPEITIDSDDVVLIDGGGRTFAATEELFFGNKNIVVLRDGTFKGQGKTRIFRIVHDGQLVLEKDVFTSGEAIYGGAILVESGGYLSVYDGRFEGNYAELDGGAIACQSCRLLDLRKAYFSKNHADRDGGAILITGADFSYVHESRIFDNSAGSGGGIYADAGADIEIKASYIQENHAINGDGGGVFSGAFLFASCTKFEGNEAENGNGGAFYQQAASAQSSIQSSYFTSNQAGKDIRGSGGAIFIGDDFILRQSSIVGNKGRRGGGIYVHSSAADDPIQIENNTIAQNNASVEGGAFWITGDNAIVVPDDENNQSNSLFGGEFSFQILHNTIYDNASENGQIFIYDAGLSASDEILFLNNIIDQPADSGINCQGNVSRLRTRRLNDLSNEKHNSQWPGLSCGQDMIGAHGTDGVDYDGLFKQGVAYTIIPDLGDVIACANVKFEDQFGRHSKCRLGAVRSGAPVPVDDPTAPK